MSDPLLLFLALDFGALLLLGVCAGAMPAAITSILTIALCGVGLFSCLTPLLLRLPTAALTLPAGPPGLSLHFVLDPLSVFFLAVVYLAATALAAFQETMLPAVSVVSLRMIALCVAGAVCSLLAADSVTLAIGLSLSCGAICRPLRPTVRPFAMLIPLLALVAVCLLAPGGTAPRFETIRTAAAGPAAAAVAAALVTAAGAGLAWIIGGQRGWTQDALAASVQIPLACYLLLRIVTDLSAGAAQAWWGFVLMLGGSAAAVVQAWRSASHPRIDSAVTALVRRQAGLATACVGLALVGRAADLPTAASFALEAACLTAFTTALAGTLASLAAHGVGSSSGSYLLSHLGGLVRTMPSTAAALAAGILALAALPPSLGFASLWLSFQAILSGPRTGGLLSQLPLALTAAGLALSAGLATAASVRLIGVAMLGRPRTQHSAEAHESKSTVLMILLTLAAASALAGLLPGLLLRLLAQPAIQALMQPVGGTRVGIGLPSMTSAAPGYLALPLAALLALAITAVLLAVRRSTEAKPAGPWTDGMTPPAGLPFGDPAAQSSGSGFLPALPAITLPPLPHPVLRNLSLTLVRQRLNAFSGLWLMVIAYGTLFLVLALRQ